MRCLLLWSLIGCVTTPMHIPIESDSSALGESITELSVESSEPADMSLLLDSGLGLDFQWSEQWALPALSGRLHGMEIMHSTTGAWTLRYRVDDSHGSEMGTARGRKASPSSSPMMESSDSASSFGSRGLGGVAIGSSSGHLSSPSERVYMGDEGGVVDEFPGSRGVNPLRAGTTDDNKDFDAYLAFLEGWTERDGVSGRFDAMEVSGRRWVVVRDAMGAPLPGAQVSVLDPTTERVVWSGTTYGDGRMPFYPELNPAGAPDVKASITPEGGWIVQALSGSTMTAQRWMDGQTELELRLDVEPAVGPVQVDVAFVIDTTGSMSDEISRIKQTLLNLTERLGDEQEVELRYGAVLYRDLGDVYVTSRHPFTSDLEAFDAALQGIQAGGGGDMPESLNQGLAEAVGSLEWREDVAKVAFVIADAPPHTDYQEDISYSYSAASALHQGIRIHTVAASGLDDLGSLVFRQVAQLTRGKFIFIEYGSVAASAMDHGVTGPVSANNLDDILYQQIRSEIQGWGREPMVASDSGR